MSLVRLTWNGLRSRLRSSGAFNADSKWRRRCPEGVCQIFECTIRISGVSLTFGTGANMQVFTRANHPALLSHFQHTIGAFTMLKPSQAFSIVSTVIKPSFPLHFCFRTSGSSHLAEPRAL